MLDGLLGGFGQRLAGAQRRRGHGNSDHQRTYAQAGAAPSVACLIRPQVEDLLFVFDRAPTGLAVGLANR